MATEAAQAQEYAAPHAYLQPEDMAEFFAVVDIPQGGFTRCDIEAETGDVIVERHQSMPVVYPTNYGSIPSLYGMDGEPTHDKLQVAADRTDRSQHHRVDVGAGCREAGRKARTALPSDPNSTTPS